MHERIAPQGRGRRLRPGGHPRVWALIVAMGAGALALTLAHVGHLPALGPHPRPAWWLLAAAFAVAELCVVHVEFRRNVHIFSLSELPLVFGLIFAQPWAMLLGILLGPIVVLVVNRGQSPVKVAFNVTLFWLGGAARGHHLPRAARRPGRRRPGRVGRRAAGHPGQRGARRAARVRGHPALGPADRHGQARCARWRWRPPCA